MCLVDIELRGHRRVPEERVQLQGLGAGLGLLKRPQVCLGEVSVVMYIDNHEVI